MKKRFLILETAMAFLGERSIRGPEHNKSIVEFFISSGFPFIKDDDTPWCSAFINFITMYLDLPSSHSLLARSWEKIGVETTKPEIGDIVTFWRISKESGFGHVGIYLGQDDNNIWVLGGNQNNMVGIDKYSKEFFTGFRNIVGSNACES